MQKKIKRKFVILNVRFLNYLDGLRDKRTCGQSLVKFVPSLYEDKANGVGMTGCQSTHYAVLGRVFSHVRLTSEDVFLDVGCGKGRVLAYLVSQNCPAKLCGIEINEIPCKIGQEWSQKYDNVEIRLGDAFALDYNAYTVTYMSRPFYPETFKQFIETMEASLTHPIRFIYYVDQQSGYFLKDRPGWKLLIRERLYRIHGVIISTMPQTYSIWTYDPAMKGETIDNSGWDKDGIYIRDAEVV